MSKAKSEVHPAILEDVAKTQKEALQTIEKSSAAMMAGVTRWSGEFSHFISERIQEDVRTQREMLQCKDLEEIRAIQTRFFQKAMEQYAEEATRLLKMGSEILTPKSDRH